MGTNGLRVLAAGRGLVESLRWHGDRLYFSDWSAGQVLGIDLDGRSEVVATVKSLPLCTAFLPDGGLVIVSSADEQNAVWYADVPNRRCARVAEGGRVLQTVDLDRGGFACMLGGPDGTTLFIVAATWQGMTDSEMVAPGSGQVLATAVDVPAAGWP